MNIHSSTLSDLQFNSCWGGGAGTVSFKYEFFKKTSEIVLISATLFSTKFLQEDLFS